MEPGSSTAGGGAGRMPVAAAERGKGLEVEVVLQDTGWRRLLPGAEALARRAAGAALRGTGTVAGTVTVLLADDRALRRLNAEHRGVDKPTNVLSFPATAPPRTGISATSPSPWARSGGRPGRRASGPRRISRIWWRMAPCTSSGTTTSARARRGGWSARRPARCAASACPTPGRSTPGRSRGRSRHEQRLARPRRPQRRQWRGSGGGAQRAAVAPAIPAPAAGSGKRPRPHGRAASRSATSRRATGRWSAPTASTRMSAPSSATC